MRHLLSVILITGFCHATACGADEPRADAPAWSAVRHERGGWILTVTQVSRQPSIDLATVLGGSGVKGTVTAPAGNEYLVVRLHGDADPAAPDIELGAATVVDAAGARHGPMMTNVVIGAARREMIVPTPVPIGADLRWIEIGGLHWPLR